jgi:hypothetical protein
MAVSIFERYDDSGEKDCLCSEPDMDRVGYAFGIIRQVKELTDE